jgi:hypothetical protein
MKLWKNISFFLPPDKLFELDGDEGDEGGTRAAAILSPTGIGLEHRGSGRHVDDRESRPTPASTAPSMALMESSPP